MKRLVAIIWLGLVCASWSALATAQDAALALADQRYNSVPYLSGGVGEDERALVLARAGDYNLKLVFAEKSGAYLADVDVVILDAKGQTVLAAKSAGPILMARLPAGSYRVQAASDGRTQQKSTRVSGRAALTFLW